MSDTVHRRTSRLTSEPPLKKKRVPLRPIEYIHQATYDAFAPLVNIFDPGIKDWNGEVIHMIPKKYWTLNWRAKRGETNLMYNGNPWNGSFIARNVFKVQHVRDHIDRRAKHYFTGGKDGMTTFMLDHDEHETWQKGLARPAWDILAAHWRTYFGSEPYHRDSGGGYHAYPILSYPLDYLDKDGSYNAVNVAYLRLQHVIGELLLANGNYSTFEIKGTITTKAKSGYLAAYPLCTFASWTGRDSWNLDHLRRFKEQRVITLDELNEFIDYLTDIVAEQPQLLEHHRRIKEAIQEQYRKQQEAVPATREQAVPAAAEAPVEKVATAKSEPAPTPPTASTAARSSSRLTARVRNLDLDADNPDSRQREHRVLMAAARQLGRVPTLAEAIGILDQPDHYWNDKRRKRVMGTLRYIAINFDPAKCRRGGDKPKVDLDKYTTIFTNRYRGRKINAGKLSAFVSAVEWSLDHPVRGDGSVPRNWIAKLTGLSNEMCKKLAKTVVREGIFITDLSDYSPNQARRWKIGNNFPGREWWRGRKKEASLRSMLRIELRRGRFAVVAPLRSAPANTSLSGLGEGKASSSTGITHTTYHNTLVSKRTTFLPSAGPPWRYPGRGPPGDRLQGPIWSG